MPGMQNIEKYFQNEAEENQTRDNANCKITERVVNFILWKNIK